MVAAVSLSPISRRRVLGGALALGTAALLSACAPQAVPQPVVGQSPRQGGDLTFLITTLANGWVANNTSISSYEANVWGQITDKLVYADEDGVISPWIAEHWDTNADSTEFTLHLKQGVTFSDGSPLDAHAVVLNLDYWAKGAPQQGIPRVGLFPSATYRSARAVDPHTVRVNFSAPTLGFIPTLGYHGSILLAPRTISGSAKDQADLSRTYGSGPFVVRSWKENNTVVLEKRADYAWGPAKAAHTGPAYLDTITFKVVAEGVLRSSAVQSNQADVGFNVSPLEVQALKRLGFVVNTPRYLGFVHGYRVNTRAPFFGDPGVREAIQWGINRQEILDTVYTSDWQTATSFLQGQVAETTDNSGLFGYNPVKAAQALERSGWVKGEDGYYAKDGRALEFVLSPTPYLVSSGPEVEIVAQNLKKLGIKVSQQAYDVSAYKDKIDKNTAQGLIEVSRSFIDVGTVSGVLTSTANGEDWFGLGESDLTLNELSSAIAHSSDKKKRAKDIARLQKYVLEKAYFIPLEQMVQRIYLQAPRVQGVTFNALAIPNYYDTWLADTPH